VAGVARKHGLKLHLDGARLLNAVVASGIPASAYAAPADSAWIDLSKGLGCPVGGVLAGSKEFIEQAWRFKHQFGGAMRQAGIIAAAGVYALENHVERMAEDHANARLLAEGLAGIKGIGINPNEIDTNMVYFTVGGTGLSEQEFARRLRTDHGVRIGPQGKDLMRAVTHLDVSRADIEEAIRACAAVVQG
jgi:threonine aldolase